MKSDVQIILTRTLTIGPATISGGLICGGGQSGSFYAAPLPWHNGYQAPRVRVTFSTPVYGVNVQGKGTEGYVYYTDNFRTLEYNLGSYVPYTTRDYFFKSERSYGQPGITWVEIYRTTNGATDHVWIKKINFTTTPPEPPPSNLRTLEPSINPDTGDISVPWQVYSAISFIPKVWVSVEVWSGNNTQQYIKDLALDACVNKSWCQSVATLPFSARSPLDRGNSYLTSIMDPIFWTSS